MATTTQIRAWVQAIRWCEEGRFKGQEHAKACRAAEKAIAELKKLGLDGNGSRTVRALGHRATVTIGAVVFYAPVAGGLWTEAGRARLTNGRVVGLVDLAIPRDVVAALIKKIEGA